jgi:ABC-2 type transport system ATP-binding protein
MAYGCELVARLDADLERPVRDLSKGNKQKIGIVLAFMHRPRLLVLDEPTSGLDPLVQDEFVTLLRETVSAGGTVLLSSHDLDEVQRVVGRVAIIRTGRIVVDDTVEALRRAASRTIDATFDHDIDVTAFGRTPGVTVDLATPRHVILTHVGSAAPVLSVLARLEPDTITAGPADLEELFLRLYEEDAHVA